LIQYAAIPAEDLGNQMFSGFWEQQLNKVFGLFLEIPGLLDWIFMATVFSLSLNILSFAFFSQKEGWWKFFFMLTIGLPVWVLIMQQLMSIRDKFIEYLSQAIVQKPTMPFMDWFTNNTLEFTIFIYIGAIIINRVDWENVKEKITGRLGGSSGEETLDERFQQ